MKDLKALAALTTLCLSGCISPNWQRFIPETKDADIMIDSQGWGQSTTIHIVTRVATNTASLSLPRSSPLPTSQ